MHQLTQRRVLCRPSLAVGVVLLTAQASAQTEIRIELPTSIQAGQCRPVNISIAEMEDQWALHYKYSQRMRRNSALDDIERKSLATLAMTPKLIQCFSGSDVFAAICFSSAETKSLNVRTIKLMHAASGADCLTLTTIAKK